MSALASSRKVPAVPARAGRRLRVLYGLLGVLLVGYLVSLLLRRSGAYSSLLDGWSVAGFEVVASVLCIARGLVQRAGRAVPLTLGFGLLSWAIGDLVMTVESLGGATPGSPSLADAFYLLFYPLAYVAIVIVVRGEVRKLSTPSWLDGLIAGLGASAVCAAFAFHGILHSTGERPLATATNLAYPIGDLLLLALVVGGSALLAGRRKTPWLLMGGGIALNAVGDTFNLFQHSIGATHTGSVFNAIAWPTATLMMSVAVWVAPRPSELLAEQRPPGFVLPELAGICALAILVVGGLHPTGHVALALAGATLLAVGLRVSGSARTLRALSVERHRQSVTDELTGLGNRRQLFQVLDGFFADAASAALPAEHVAFLFIDLNHFKQINDSFGHPAGDELLRQIGPRMRSVLRDSDLAVRFGGDELAVVLISKDADYATWVAERLSAAISEPFVLGSVRASVGAAIGIAFAPADASDSASLVWCADVAMYRAKLSNAPFAVFDHEPDLRGNRLLLAEELRAALADEDQLVLHYQPQLDLQSGEIVAVEALLRWLHPTLGLLPPLTFLPLAEEVGLMQALTTLVLEQALSQCAAWQTAETRLAVSVNVSASNLLDPGFTDLVAALLERHEVRPEALILELTETSVISEFEESRAVIERLRALGVVVSIDDFGAGFTSLAYLNSLAVGELKLDRTFIAGLSGESEDHDNELVRSTIDLGHALGLRVVAEGIEDRATLELLTSFGCDRVQGYLISKPKPANEFAFTTPAGTREPLTRGHGRRFEGVLPATPGVAADGTSERHPLLHRNGGDAGHSFA